MYLKLKSQYILRGWEKAAWAIVKRPRNLTYFISRELFNLLILCDGVTEITDEMLELGLNKDIMIDGEKVLEKLEEPSPLDEDQYYRYYDNRYVEGAFWSITGRCNYRCKHCFMDAPEGIFGELNTEEALDLIDQMNECGILNVDITGGEPLVRPDFWQLVDRILSYKMTIRQIYTNAWLLNEKMLDEFEKRDFRPEFHISFDGVGWHDWMRGINGAEKAALRAFKLCQERGLFTSVQMCIFKSNVDSLPETIETLSKLGVHHLSTGFVSNTDLWKANSDGNDLSWSEYLDHMLEYIPKFFEQGRPMGLNLGGLVQIPSYRNERPIGYVVDRQLNCDKAHECHTCPDARATCYVAPNGRMIPCMPMTAAPQKIQEQFPMVQEIGLKKALSESFYMEFIDRRVSDIFEVNKKCAGCKHKYACGGGCRAEASLKGDLMGSDWKMCITHKQGYIEKSKEAVRAAIRKYCPELEAELEA